MVPGARASSHFLLVVAGTAYLALVPGPGGSSAGQSNPPPFRAGSGPVPIRVTPEAAPLVLERAGSYVLTASAELKAGTLLIIAADDVILDLAGFRLGNEDQGAAATADLIQLVAGVSNVTLRNGSLVGGRRAVAGGPVGALRLEDLRLQGQETGVELQPVTDLEFRRVSILVDQSGIRLRGVPTGRLRVHETEIEVRCPERRVGSGIVIFNAFLAVEIRSSNILVGPCSDGEGIGLASGGATITGSVIRSFTEDGPGVSLPGGGTVTDNSISGPDYALVAGGSIQVKNNQLDGSVLLGSDSLVLENRIFGFRNHALQVAQRNRIEKNTIRESGGGDTLTIGSDNAVRENTLSSQQGCTWILSVLGSRNLLEANQVTGCHGIVFQGTASDNIYRGNVLVGAAMPVERFGTGTNNLDGGGNVCKGPCP